MKFSLLAAAPLLVASTTLAHSPLKRGQAADTCANLDADLVFSDVEVDGKPYNAGHIDIGLCVSQVSRFIPHFDVTEAAVKVVGVDKVTSTLTDLIRKAGVQCTYPPHAIPSVRENDVCSFVCKDGFLPLPANHPLTCGCPSHLKECNGQCGHFSLDCSKVPPPSRRQHGPKCAEGLTLCGATSGQAVYKCVDVTSDPSTCGGCVKAAPFGSLSKVGVNCHDIPNVDKVSCVQSTCVVHTCKGDFTVSADAKECVADPHVRGLPAPSLGPLGAPVDVVVEGVNVIGGGSAVGGVSAFAGPLGATRHVLPAGKFDPKVPRTCPVTASQC